MAYNAFYEGAYSSLDPEFSRQKNDLLHPLAGMRVPAGRIGMSTDPRTANQIAELGVKLNPGIKHIELGALSPDVFESIPQQHLKEINRLSKLTGVDVSVHGILAEPTGFTQQGYNETNREGVERQMLNNVEKASVMNPGGVVVFHASSSIPEAVEKVYEKDENGKLVPVQKAVSVINTQDFRIATLRDTKERYFPDKGEQFTGEPIKFDAETQLNRINSENWRRSLQEINFTALRGSEALIRKGSGILNDDAIQKIKDKKISFEDFGKLAPRAEQEYYNHEHGVQFLQSAYREMQNLFDLAFKTAKENGNEVAKEKLTQFVKEVESNRDKLDNSDVLLKTVQKGLTVLEDKSIGNPSYYKRLDEFALEKSATTFGDVAWQAYKKLGDKAPVIAIENPPAGGGFSRAEDLKPLIEESRKKFQEQAVKNGYSEKDAKEISKKMIGATWDVGHINMLRKFGADEKTLLEQTKIIAPYVKHVHLSDNFGLDHTELPMGMGNVPLKKEMEILEKENFKGKRIIEAGNWWQHFKTPPVGESLEAMGSPLYAMQMGPYWNQVRGTYGNYFSGYGPTLPEQHFSIYGGGFSSLPQELGGQVPGKQSRFSGTPNE